MDLRHVKLGFIGALLAGCLPQDGDLDGPPCGGIAGIACPGSGTCLDDPRDSCDPEAGGADCGGVCQCDVIGVCAEGWTWDGSPEVCSCVEGGLTNPCAAVLCLEGTHCEVVDGVAECVEHDPADPCATVRCEPGRVCEVVDGDAVCVPQSAPGETCGATTCPVGQTCCNASCGICTPPGGACIQIACESSEDDS